MKRSWGFSLVYIKRAGDLTQLVEFLCLACTRFYSQHHIKSSMISHAYKSQHSGNGDTKTGRLRSSLATQTV